MTELERALRAAFALDPGVAPGPGFEARVVRAARAHGRGRSVPVALAAAVAGAAIATLIIGRGGEAPQRAALDPPPAPVAPARAGGGASSSASVTDVWELVIRFSRSWSAERAVTGDEEPTPPPAPPRQRRSRRHRAADPPIDCGNDPLCPLVAPQAAKLSIGTSGGWARVSIDGQDAGATPISTELIPGRHRITARFHRGGTRTVEVNLAPGEQRKLLLSADPDPPPR